MGYMRHHAIIVTGPADKAGRGSIQEVWGEALRIAERYDMSSLVSMVTPSKMNAYGTFMVAPDGSKEGWVDSDCGDAMRNAVIAYLNTKCYEDGSTSFKWAEVQYGDDDKETKICRHSEDADEPTPMGKEHNNG